VGPMVTIRSTTMVHAPMERCFRLAVSIDLQIAASGRKALDGVTSGLIGPGDSVTWQGSLFGTVGRHQSLIEVWHPYTYFRDIMVDGHFKSYEHDHHFAPLNDGTRIRDEIRFSASSGMLGRIRERFFLRRKLTAMLKQRNALIKQAAESDQWHDFLDGQAELDLRAFQAPSAAPRQQADSIYAGY
jgi:ligand-binding SRPBCC domain-containing protein